MDQDNSYYTPYNVDLATLPDEPARKRYIEQVLALPKTLVDIIFNADTAVLIEEEWGARFNLSASQKQELARIIRDAILAEFPLKSLSEVVQKKLLIDEMAAKDLTKELVVKVLITGWDDLKKINEIKFKSPPESPLSSPSVNAAPSTPVIPPSPLAVNPHNVLDLRKKDN